MPKSSRHETCFICQEVPCICFAKPKKQNGRQPRRDIPAPETVTVVAAHDRFGDRSGTDRDLTMVNALTVLYDCLDKDSQAEADKLLRPPFSQEMDKELTLWKRRRNGP